MSAARPSERPRDTAQVRPRDISHLHARRREANRRRRLLRVDVGVGVLAALVVLIATPGLAIAAILAGVALGACIASAIVQRRRRRAAVRGVPRM